MRILKRAGFRTMEAESGEIALETLGSSPVDVVLLDIVLPGINGLDTLDRIKRAHRDVEVVMMTGHADLSLAVDAVRRGAHDFLAKPFGSNELVVLAVEKANEHANLVAAARVSQGRAWMPPLVGESEAMLKVYALAKDVAATSVSVLLLGETGTGKEILARAIHDAGPRANRTFVATNCSAIPDDLVESEFFGHERGAFTGATRTRPGLFQQAHGGTIFLDEVGDLPLLGQAKLLRALQGGEVRSVGADETRRLDVRVISATNANLKTKLKQKRFREDLYYRLNVVTIQIPPLTERKADIPLLAQHFVDKHAKRLGIPPKRLSQDAVWHLMAYRWPGNVRQLENVLERALVVTRGSIVHASDLTLQADGTNPQPTTEGEPAADGDLYALPFSEAKKRAVLSFEARYIRKLLEQTDGNVSEAARRSGLDRTNLRRILRRTKGVTS